MQLLEDDPEAIRAARQDLGVSSDWRSLHNPYPEMGGYDIYANALWRTLR